MPAMNVRGDQHLNFTREEAAAWLGRDAQPYYPRQYYPRVAHDDHVWGFAWVFVALGLFVVLAIIGAAFSGSPQKQMASNAARTSAPARTAAMQARESRRQATVPRPAVALRTYENHESEGAYLPIGWSAGRLIQNEPFTDRNGIRIGTIPKGTLLMYQITDFSGGWRQVVAADGSLWGFSCIHPPSGALPRAPMRPEYAAGVAIIWELQSPGPQGQRRRGLVKYPPPPWPNCGEEV